jgi:transcriptional regulator with XRE-family HTH domain
MTRAAVYRHFAADGTLLYVGASHDPTRRLYEHKCRTDWAGEVARTIVDWFDSREAALEAERKAIRSERPAHNLTKDIRVGGDGALPNWLRAQNVSVTEFARSLGLNASSVSRFCSGQARPSLDTAMAIERETNGAVPASFWSRQVAATASGASA